jgi:hypothetical protein
MGSFTPHIGLGTALNVTPTPRTALVQCRRLTFLDTVLLWIMIVAAAAPYRFWIPFGPFRSFSVLEIALIVSAMRILPDLLRGRVFQRRERMTFVLLTLPAAICLLSMLWSEDPSLTFKELLIYLESSIAYLVAYIFMRRLRPDRILLLSGIYIILMLIPCALAALDTPGFSFSTLETLAPTSQARFNLMMSSKARLSSPFIGLSNDLATILGFFAPILFMGSRCYRSRFLLCSGFFALVGCVLTQSRGVLFATLLCGIGLLFSTKRILRNSAHLLKAVILGLLVVVLATGAVHLYVSNSPFSAAQLPDRLVVAQDFAGRMTKLQFGIAAILDAPLLGYGANALPGLDAIGALHNSYLIQIASYGILLGTLTNMCLLAFPWPTLLTSTSCVHEHLLAKAFGYSMVGQLLIYSVETSFQASVVRVLCYFSFGIGGALLYAAKNQRVASAGVGLDPSRLTREHTRIGWAKRPL